MKFACLATQFCTELDPAQPQLFDPVLLMVCGACVAVLLPGLMPVFCYASMISTDKQNILQTFPIHAFLQRGWSNNDLHIHFNTNHNHIILGGTCVPLIAPPNINNMHAAQLLFIVPSQQKMQP